MFKWNKNWYFTQWNEDGYFTVTSQYQHRHNKKYYWASDNQKQVPLLSIIFTSNKSVKS